MLLEVCIDDPLRLAEAVAGGADRIELCAALGVGGLTPSAGLMELAMFYALSCYPMIRPRTGDFDFTPAEVAVMRADIRAARTLGLTGVVLGASLLDGSLDTETLATLVAEAEGLDLTLHRAVDLTPDIELAVSQAVDLGFHRILTSGGALQATQGIARLEQMISASEGRLSIVPGSGVSLESWPFLEQLDISEVHASCAAPLPANETALRFGFQTAGEKRTSRESVAALKAVIG